MTKKAENIESSVPYIVTLNGIVKYHTIESMRYPAEIEMQMLEAGYVITIGGKKLTRKAVQERLEKR